ncbi:hypothetical protein L9F63_024910, partial [Diploptera punctata]
LGGCVVLPGMFETSFREVSSITRTDVVHQASFVGQSVFRVVCGNSYGFNSSALFGTLSGTLLRMVLIFPPMFWSSLMIFPFLLNFLPICEPGLNPGTIGFNLLACSCFHGRSYYDDLAEDFRAVGRGLEASRKSSNVEFGMMLVVFPGKLDIIEITTSLIERWQMESP